MLQPMPRSRKEARILHLSGEARCLKDLLLGAGLVRLGRMVHAKHSERILSEVRNSNTRGGVGDDPVPPDRAGADRKSPPVTPHIVERRSRDSAPCAPRKYGVIAGQQGSLGLDDRRLAIVVRAQQIADHPSNLLPLVRCYRLLEFGKEGFGLITIRKRTSRLLRGACDTRPQQQRGKDCNSSESSSGDGSTLFHVCLLHERVCEPIV